MGCCYKCNSSGVKMSDIQSREKSSMLKTYKRFPITISHGKGSYVYSADGRNYLDFLSGIAVNALGHSHPDIIKAATEQMQKFMHVSNFFYQEPQVEMAERLIDLIGYGRVFFSNSGTEAMEGALKLARRYGNMKGKSEIIAFTGGFHGRTYGPLSIMDKPKYKENMGPFLGNTIILKYNDLDALENTINDKTQAVVLEIIQGEGGITTAKNDFLKKLDDLRRKYGFLIIADEIQTGGGRTGTFLASHHFNFKPDIITLAKAIGGNLPLGAFVASDHLKDVFETGMHGTTYGGNPVACATGIVVMDKLKNGLMDEVAEKGDYLIGLLNEIQKQYSSSITEVRGKGFILGLKLNIDGQLLLNNILKRGAIANIASGDVLRILPPLIASTEEIDEFCNILSDSLNEIEKNA